MKAEVPHKRTPRFGWLLGAVLFIGFCVVQITHVQALVRHTQGGASSHSGHQIQQPAAVTNGLVAWYPLDGNTTDSSRNGSNGAMVGGSASYASGKYASAYGSSGTKYINVASSTLAGNNVTFSAWIKPTSKVLSSIVQKNGPFFFGYGDPPSANNSGTVCANFNVGTGWTHGACGTTAVPLNAWSLATVSFDGTTERTYLNGVLDAQATNAGSITAISSFQIGGGTGSSFPGAIDDVRAYNRTLSASEIALLFQGTQPQNCDQSCVGWWKLDEQSGTTTKDSTGNGNTGTLNNFTFGAVDGWTGGVFSNALQFNLQQSILSTVAVPPVNDLTFSTWVYPTQSNSLAVFGLSTSAAGNQFLLETNTVNSVGFRVYNPASGNNELSGSANALSINQWNYVAVTRDSAGNRKLYINGVLSASDVYAPWRSSSNQLYLGREGTNTGSFAGKLDDARLYNRALLPYEIYEQYSAGR